MLLSPTREKRTLRITQQLVNPLLGADQDGEAAGAAKERGGSINAKEKVSEWLQNSVELAFGRTQSAGEDLFETM